VYRQHTAMPAQQHTTTPVTATAPAAHTHRHTRAPLALVTGASSGIGRHLAQGLAARGYDLALVARREELLIQLAATLHEAYGTHCYPIAADLARYEERERVLTALAPRAAQLAVLVNNAGFGTHGYFHETNLERELELIAVNCAAPVHLTKRILPWMLARHEGYIMNVASVSSFMPGPLMAIYYASKAFLLSFSEALHEEYRRQGIRVTALCPGPVRTEFQRTAGILGSARSSIASPMDAGPVAEAGLNALFAGKRVETPGLANKAVALAGRLLPRRWMLHWVRDIQEERRRQTRLAMEGH
jgi:short-subunit dehydrogenase